MESIRRILLVGGTHGNEMTGIQLVRDWLRDSAPLQRSSLDVQLLLANPEAIRLGRRYVESDLNRAFSKELLDSSQPAQTLDVKRAREIAQQFGHPDLAIDLHNTTSNMGITLILNRPDPAVKRICAILSKEFEDVHILFQPEPEEMLSYLPSLGIRDITIEVGPQAHGTLRASLLLRTQSLIYRLFDLLQAWNEGTLPREPEPLRFFQQIGTMDYPRREDGSIAAMIHPSLEGQDFQPIFPGKPIFLNFEMQDIPWKGENPIYPCFLGEAAYLEKRIAFSILQSIEDSW